MKCFLTMLWSASSLLTPNYTWASRSPMFTCTSMTSVWYCSFLFAVGKSGKLWFWIRSCHDVGSIDFAVWLGAALESKRNKVRIYIVWVLQMVFSTLYFFAVSEANLVSAPKKTFVNSIISSYDGMRLVTEFIVCGNAERSDFNEVPFEQSLVVRLTVWRSSVSSFSTVPPLMTQPGAACRAHLLVVQSFTAVLDSSRFQLLATQSQQFQKQVLQVLLSCAMNLWRRWFWINSCPSYRCSFSKRSREMQSEPV